MEGPLCPPPDPGFRLIETFLWMPGDGVQRRARHLDRLLHSAARLGIVPQGVEAALSAISGTGPLRGRLTVDVEGRAEVTTTPFTALPEGTVWRVTLAAQRLDPADPWLGVKTTQRALYDSARAAMPGGVDELVFLNTREEICEGTITNLFVETEAGLVTPPLDCGVLPGVLREEMLATGQVSERKLTQADLLAARALWVGNSLRGLIRARLV